jgi:hypothetical protein
MQDPWRDPWTADCAHRVAEAIGCPPERAGEVALQTLAMMLDARWQGQSLNRRIHGRAVRGFLRQTWALLRGVRFLKAG